MNKNGSKSTRAVLRKKLKVWLIRFSSIFYGSAKRQDVAAPEIPIYAANLETTIQLHIILVVRFIDIISGVSGRCQLVIDASHTTIITYEGLKTTSHTQLYAASLTT